MMRTAAHRELELKAVVPDPDALRARLRAAGAVPGYAGLLRDRRYDQNDALAARGEVLRVREYRHADGSVTTQLTWKGPTQRSVEGYKLREEIELQVGDPAARGQGGAAAAQLLEALAYAAVHTLDRWIESYTIEGASVRMEWYPRMDVLVEVEGDPDAIEKAIVVSGLPRSVFSCEPLAAFAERFRARGDCPILSLAELGGVPPAWATR